MGRRILNDALRTMVNAERRGKATALLQPISGVMVSFLNIMKHRGISSILFPPLWISTRKMAQRLMTLIFFLDSAHISGLSLYKLT
jgi:ribosomal protein S8